ncbi:MAG: YCF48-related protein [Rubrivivax sp.]
MPLMKRRRWLCGLALAGAFGGAMAAASFPALDHPAMAVRAPERDVLLAAALAGQRVVAVGERGIVVLSDDGARTWRQAHAVPVAVTLTAVQFVDAQRGWAVGHGGIVLHSEDGGENWVRQADGRTLAQAVLAAQDTADAHRLVAEGPDKPLLDLRFVDARHGYIVGAYNLAFETRDGGATWSSLMSRIDNPRGVHLYSIAVRGDSVFIAGEQGAMFRSRDGGASFAALQTSYRGSWFSVMALPGRGLVAAGLRGNAMYSPDDGETWTAIEGTPPVTLVHGTVLPDSRVLMVNQAGELFMARSGSPIAPLRLRTSLPAPSALLPLPEGALLVVGLTGAIRLPTLEPATR